MAARDVGSVVEGTHDGVRRDGFSGPALSHDANDFPLASWERHSVEGLHHSVTGTKVQREVVDDELSRHTRFRGSSRSRRPSPSMLNEKTAATNAAPGNMKAHHSPEMM